MERSYHKEYTCEISLIVYKLWLRLECLKSRSNFNVNITKSKVMVPMERSCHKEYMWNTKALPLMVYKLWWKFLSTNEDNATKLGIWQWFSRLSSQQTKNCSDFIFVYRLANWHENKTLTKRMWTVVTNLHSFSVGGGITTTKVPQDTMRTAPDLYQRSSDSTDLILDRGIQFHLQCKVTLWHPSLS